MNFFEKFVLALQFPHERPGNYGWFHITFIVLAIIGTVLFCCFASKAKEKTFRLIVAISWIVMVVFEIYKQLVFSFDSNSVTWSLDWNSFPFQLCSSPLYILPFIAFMKDCKFRDGAIMFITTFSLLGGLCVFVYPNDVFETDFLGVQIQTMVHHGLQIVLGIYMAVFNKKKYTLKNFFFGAIIFVGMLLIALTLNLTITPLLDGRKFNMYFIGPYFPCELPILGAIYQVVPHFVFFFIYGLGFIFCAGLLRYIIYGIMLLVDKIKAKNA